MADIRLHAFRGKRPYVKTEHLLGLSDASDCDDTIFESGLIRGVNDNVLDNAADAAFAASLTLYQYEDTGDWFTFVADTDITTVLQEPGEEIIMYTDGIVEPRITNAALIGVGPTIGAFRTVGITAPTAAPVAAVAGVEDPAPELNTRSYVYTWVDSVSGFESAPSPVSNIVTMDEVGQSVNVTMSTTAPVDGTYNVDTKRIYRTVTGTATVEFQFVAEVPLATAVYNDSIISAETGEVLLTDDFERPPLTMQGVTAHPAGFFVGFDGNTMCFSEPGFYYAWPVKYQFELEFPIVGIATIGGYVAVMTEGVPFLITGSAPFNMVPRKLEEYLPCVSKRSITEMGAFVIYAGEDSLVQISAQGATPISQGLMTREQWKATTPANIFGTRWRGLYLAVYPTYIDIWAPNGLEVGITTINQTFKSEYVDEGTGDLYLVNSANEIVIFADAGSSTTAFTWVSKPIMFARPLNFACMRALGTFGGTIGLEEDDSAPSETGDNYAYTTPLGDLVNNTPIRLPQGILYKGLRITINGIAGDELHELHLATSIMELPGTDVRKQSQT